MVDRREDLERPNIEGLWLEVSLPKSRSFLTGCFYRPPNSSDHYDKDFSPKMNNTLNTAVSKGQEVVLFGVLMYTDDTVLFCARSNSKVIKDNLNQGLNTFGKWLQVNGLFLNTTKTEAMLFGTHSKLSKQRL